MNILAFFLCFCGGIAVPSIHMAVMAAPADLGEPTFHVETVAQGLGVPWGFAFLSPQEMLLTEREGQVRILNLRTGSLRSVQGAPMVAGGGQGGMLDLVLHPQFAANRWVYLSYVVTQEGGRTTRVSRAQLKDDHLRNLEVLFTAQPVHDELIHFGSRFAFDEAGYLFFTVGDRGNRNEAQDLSSHLGKVLRLHDDGRVPKDNPFVGRKNAAFAIWSYGHRNPQGLIWDVERKILWETEHGPRGGDEINRIEKGKNYGWPVISHGREYSGPKIGEGTHKEGMEQPVKVYTPSIAPCGLAIYRGNAFPAWKGDLFLGALILQHINHVKVKDDKIVGEARLLESHNERIRNIKEGPDGFLYVSTDSGKILRLRPVPSKGNS